VAGQRRTRTGDPQAPLQRKTRKDRRKDALMRRISTAQSPIQRCEFAWDYLRGAAARRQPNPELAGRLIEAAADALIDAGDKLLNMQAKEEKNPTIKEESAA
jgi:hypothetical protein